MRSVNEQCDRAPAAQSSSHREDAMDARAHGPHGVTIAPSHSDLDIAQHCEHRGQSVGPSE